MSIAMKTQIKVAMKRWLVLLFVPMLAAGSLAACQRSGEGGSETSGSSAGGSQSGETMSGGGSSSEKGRSGGADPSGAAGSSESGSSSTK